MTAMSSSASFRSLKSIRARPTHSSTFTTASSTYTWLISRTSKTRSRLACFGATEPPSPVFIFPSTPPSSCSFEFLSVLQVSRPAPVLLPGHCDGTTCRCHLSFSPSFFPRLFDLLVPCRGSAGATDCRLFARTLLLHVVAANIICVPCPSSVTHATVCPCVHARSCASF